MLHQIRTLSVLWQLVAPGGFFVVEDLESSYLPQFYPGGGPRGTKNTTVAYFKDILDSQQQRYCENPADAPCELLPNMRSMECWYLACIFIKKPAA